MKRPAISLAATALMAACAGHPTTSAPASAPAPAASVLRYGAGTGRYRVEQTQHLTQEMMGQTRIVDGTSNILVTATVTADATGLAGSFTVDSITATSSAPGGAAVLESMRGKTYRATFSPSGRSTGFTPPEAGDPAAGEGNMFRDFLPMLPAGAIAEGASWIDTSDMTQMQQGISMRSQSIRSHRVVGWDLRDGARALHIATTSTYTISGSGQTQGQQVTVTGSGVATSEQFVSAAGIFLGGSVTDSASLNVNVVAMGMDIPIRQSRRATVTRLP